MNRLACSLLTLTFFLAACTAAPAASPVAPLPSPGGANASATSETAPPAGNLPSTLPGNPSAIPTTGQVAGSPVAQPTIQLTPAPLNLSQPHLVVLARALPGPDDLLLAPDGAIYISDVTSGAIHRYTSDGQIKLVLAGLSAPEGMVFLPDGSLIIAEQGKNRLMRYNPATTSLSLFYQFDNQTGQDGVDGISLDLHDPAAPSLVIPDSPNGTILRLGLGGQTKTELGRGFLRPTGAWVEPNGAILVVDENAGALKRLRPDGAIEQIARLSTPDDVIEDAQGNIFVNTLGDHAIHWIDPAGKDQVLVSDLGSPQGLIFDAAGDLIVADSGLHRLLKIVIHS